MKHFMNAYVVPFAVYAVLVAGFMAALFGCSTMQPTRPTSVADSIALSYATIEGAANQVAAACWPATLEPAPGSPCDPQGLISSEERDSMKAQLQDAKNSVDLARKAWAAGDRVSAETWVARADAVLTLVISVLEARQ